MATMPATITLATIDYAGDYSDYVWAAGGGIARPAAPLPVAGPMVRSRSDPQRPGSGLHDMRNKRIHARIRRFNVLGINTQLKH